MYALFSTGYLRQQCTPCYPKAATRLGHITISSNLTVLGACSASCHDGCPGMQNNAYTVLKACHSTCRSMHAGLLIPSCGGRRAES
jgi:hypothetical protein